MKRTGKRTGLEINDEKTKWMRATRDRDDDEEILVVDGDRLEKVTEFKYLGSTVTSQSCSFELEPQVAALGPSTGSLNPEA